MPAQIGPVEESGIGQRSEVLPCFFRSDKSASVGRSDSQTLTESSLYRKVGGTGEQTSAHGPGAEGLFAEISAIIKTTQVDICEMDEL